MDFFNKLKDTVGSVTTEASQKVSYNTEKSKINSQIRNNNKEIERIIYQIGKKCVDLHLMDENTEYEEMFSEIRRYQDENKSCEAEIIRLGKECDEQIAMYQQELKERQEQREKERLEREKEAELQAQLQAEKESVAEHTVTCTVCGASNSEEAKFCIGCGNKIDKEEKVPTETAPVEETEPVVEMIAKKTCPTCGNEIGDGELFCTECGTKIED